MKVPPRTGSRLSLSPIKIDHEATKALQESITSLLGKRPSPDADADEPGGARARGATGAVDMTGADMHQENDLWS
jgi:DNA replication regulator DPB11